MIISCFVLPIWGRSPPSFHNCNFTKENHDHRRTGHRNGRRISFRHSR